MSDEHPVFVAVDRGGRVEQVRVGTAVKSGDGFLLKLGELRIGAPAPPSYQSAPPSYGAPSYGDSAPRPAARPEGGSGGGMVFPNYGRSKGQPILGATMGDLDYYANGARRTLADPAKARFHDREKVLLAAIEAEVVRQKGMPSMDGTRDGGDEFNPPPPSDEDIPF